MSWCADSAVPGRMTFETVSIDRTGKDDDEEEKSSRGKENASREGEVVERMVRGC